MKTDCPRFYNPPTRFTVTKTDSPNFYMHPARFAVLKTDSPHFYNSSTCFAVVKTDSRNLCKPPTCFAVDKTDPQNFYMSATRFGAVKKASPNFYNPPTRFAVVKTDSPNLCKPIRFAVVKTDSRNLCKPPTRFAVDKTDRPNFYIPPTRSAVVKTNCPHFYNPPTSFAVVKTDSTNFYMHPTRFAEDNGLSELVQGYYTMYNFDHYTKFLQKSRLQACHEVESPLQHHHLLAALSPNPFAIKVCHPVYQRLPLKPGPCLQSLATDRSSHFCLPSLKWLTFQSSNFTCFISLYIFSFLPPVNKLFPLLMYKRKKKTRILHDLRLSKRTPLTSSILLYTLLRLSNRTLQTSTTLLTRFQYVKTGSPNFWKSPTMFCGIQNGLSELLHASYTFF